jgi:hypothetical protein
MHASGKVTIITPTTGKPSLDALIESIERQTLAKAAFHLLLWDDVRDAAMPAPERYNGENRMSLVLPSGLGKNGRAPGSALRAVALMATTSPWVVFADDDVRWDENHLASLFSALSGMQWATTLRTIWSLTGVRLGVDRFESVGDEVVAYLMKCATTIA